MLSYASTLLHWALSLAVQCIVIGSVYLCVCLFVCLFVCGFVALLPRYLEIACIDLLQTGSVGEGSDHLQLIKFWRSCVPKKGLRRGENFWLRLTTARAQCLRLSERFFSFSLKLCRIVRTDSVSIVIRAYACPHGTTRDQ